MNTKQPMKSKAKAGRTQPGTKPVQIWVHEDFWNRVKAAAAREGKTVGNYVADSLAQSLSPRRATEKGAA